MDPFNEQIVCKSKTFNSASQGSSISNAFRRRSTQINHTITLEPLFQQEQNNDIKQQDSTSEENALTTPSMSEMRLPVYAQPWKVYILTISITNYFFCGVNLKTEFSKWFDSIKSIPSPLTMIKNCLGGEEIGGIKIKLFFCLLDWILDFGTSAYLFANRTWIQATLTYLIVLGSGLVATMGFLRFPDIRSEMTQESKEIGKIWVVLLFIPTFFSFVSGRLWLKAAINHEKVSGTEESAEAKTLASKEKAKDRSLKAFWLETVMESKPQALLQTLFLLERDTGFTNPLDYLPIILGVWSMHSITSNIYELVALNFKDNAEIFSRIYGITYTCVSIFAPMMIVNTFRNIYTQDLEQFIATLISLIAYYLIFEAIYQLSYLLSIKILKNDKWIDSCDEKGNDRHDNDLDGRHSEFSKLYQVVLLIFFSGCLVAWNFFSQSATDNQIKRMIVIPIFSTCLIVNAISFIKAKDFVVESFRLKNVKIDESWKKLGTLLRLRSVRSS